MVGRRQLTYILGQHGNVVCRPLVYIRFNVRLDKMWNSHFNLFRCARCRSAEGLGLSSNAAARSLASLLFRYLSVFLSFCFRFLWSATSIFSAERVLGSCRMRPLTHYHPPSFILSLPCLLLYVALSSDSNSLPIRRLNPAPTPTFQHSMWNNPQSRPL
ncbi:hypothetical protein B0H14DRAFT_2774462 [Mycena olivaceomarginata]|nr:hypothetical protein B0H14DRAFT_2774462 [Mycena olivaceomarginata]